MTHTPGPWIADGVMVDDDRGRSLLHAHGLFPLGHPETRKQAVDNAQLAAAAPDLLAVVQTLARWQHLVFAAEDAEDAAWEALLVKAAAAISKTKGAAYHELA